MAGVELDGCGQLLVRGDATQGRTDVGSSGVPGGGDAVCTVDDDPGVRVDDDRRGDVDQVGEDLDVVAVQRT